MATKAARVANPPAKGEEKVKGAEGPTLIPPHQAAVDCALDNVTVPNAEFIPSVHVPQLEHPHLAPHLRVQKAAHHWHLFQDTYVSRVVSEGLKLDWIDGFNPEWPDPTFCPVWEYPKERQPPEVQNIIHQWLLQGLLTEIPWENVKCCSSIFAIPKKDSPDWRLITNLSNLNAFLQTTYFTLPTWKDIAPLLHKGMWACKVDIKGGVVGLTPVVQKYTFQV